MKEFYLVILMMYFGYRLLMGVIVLYNWNTPEMIKVRKAAENSNINDYYQGVLENILLLIATYLLYAS